VILDTVRHRAAVDERPLDAETGRGVNDDIRREVVELRGKRRGVHE
jgi:hypothetical protein